MARSGVSAHSSKSRAGLELWRHWRHWQRLAARAPVPVLEPTAGQARGCGAPRHTGRVFVKAPGAPRIFDDLDRRRFKGLRQIGQRELGRLKLNARWRRRGGLCSGGWRATSPLTALGPRMPWLRQTRLAMSTSTWASTTKANACVEPCCQGQKRLGAGQCGVRAWAGCVGHGRAGNCSMLTEPPSRRVSRQPAVGLAR